METENATREAPAGQNLSPVARRDLVLAGTAVFVFVANLAVTFLIQGPGIWQMDRLNGYLMHLPITFLGVNMWLAPIFAWQEGWSSIRYLGLYLGLAAWIVVGLIAKFGTPLPLWRRALYGYLIGAQVSNFAAVHWSTVGN